MPPVDDGHGSYRIVGKLFRVKAWEGDFSYERHPSGWNSEDLHLRTDGWRTSGGFLVSRIDDVTCRVTHYEDDRLPDQMWRWLLLLRGSRSSNPNSSMLRMTASTSWLLCGRTPVPLRRTPPVGPHDLPSADGSSARLPSITVIDMRSAQCDCGCFVPAGTFRPQALPNDPSLHW